MRRQRERGGCWRDMCFEGSYYEQIGNAVAQCGARVLFENIDREAHGIDGVVGKEKEPEVVVMK